jgi:hypothetical protein
MGCLGYFFPKNTLGRNAFRLVMRAAGAVTSGHVIWDHIVVTEPLEGLRTGLFLSVTAHVISLFAKMVILDSS